MKFNKTFDGGNFNDYIKYLDGIRNYISTELYDFISNPERHDLGEKSLHDSRIEKIEFNHNFETDTSNMTITLLGENRKFILHFLKIKKYNIKQIAENDGYTDLITYEIYVKNKKLKTLEFRAEFGFGYGEIVIVCKEIKIEENTD
ncbi:MAG: hypothetical protein LBJ63_04080 [Prevotellaceae bacterium]|jgi:hypothetical protein|nr:hypothetical protein [Prevotellaceae bacterium]